MLNVSSGLTATEELFGSTSGYVSLLFQQVYTKCGKVMSILQDHYGIDWDGPIPLARESESVEVPDTPVPISLADLAVLERLYTEEVILSSENHAIDIYVNVLSFVTQRLVQQPNYIIIFVDLYFDVIMQATAYINFQ